MWCGGVRFGVVGCGEVGLTLLSLRVRNIMFISLYIAYYVWVCEACYVHQPHT